MKRKNPGFTLVEIMVALVVFFVFTGIVFNFFVGGSKYASKGAWRVHAVASMRNGLRVVKSNLEATSYPTVVRLDNFSEAEISDFMLQLASANATTVASAHTVYTFNQPVANFILFTCCNTLDETNPGTPTGGEAKQYTFLLELNDHRNLSNSPPNARLMDLVMVESVAAITSQTGGAVVPPTAFAETDRKRLCFDVESVDFIVPTSAGPILDENTVLTMRVHCRDPLNGRMLLTEEAKAQVNVCVVKP